MTPALRYSNLLGLQLMGMKPDLDQKRLQFLPALSHVFSSI
jgi:hypothetical protein